MTRNEAIKELKENIELPPFGGSISTEASIMAISALEEIQKYRALGTVEEIEPYIRLAEKLNVCDLVRENASVYNKLKFTEERLREAMEKQRGKKPIGIDGCTCPNCGTYNEVVKKRRNTVNQDIVYCWHCGQAIEVKRSEEE